jgi:hypothetical protein
MKARNARLRTSCRTTVQLSLAGFTNGLALMTAAAYQAQPFTKIRKFSSHEPSYGAICF